MSEYRSAGIQCADCGLWPMPDPFNAVIDDDGNIVKYVCDECGNNYIRENTADVEVGHIK